MNGKTDDVVREAMIEQACAWQARCLSGEMSDPEKIEFLKWLQETPSNVREYLETARMARLFPRALEGLAPVAETVILTAASSTGVQLRQRPGARGRSWKMAAAVAIVFAGTFAGVRLWHSQAGQSYVVPHGDQRIVRLSDGSLLHLNSNSSAQVRYSKRERLIELDVGQAMFDVARDASRPFRVRAGRTEVLAIGTQFDVYRRDDKHVTVTVVEGRVEVIDRASAASAASNKDGATRAHPVRLDVGQQVRAGGEGALVSNVDVSSATAWVRREIVFNGRPLGEVATEFNRYLTVPVFIDDATLRATKVSGVFSAYDEAAFIGFLKEFDGVRVDVGDKEIHVRGQAAP